MRRRIAEDAARLVLLLFHVHRTPRRPEALHPAAVLEDVGTVAHAGRFRFAYRFHRRTLRRVIHQVTQFFARLEVRDAFRGDFHPRSGLRIASHARLALPSAKTAKPADLDLFSLVEAVHNAVEDGLHDGFRILSRHLHNLGYFLDQLSLRHTCISLFLLV